MVFSVTEAKENTNNFQGDDFKLLALVGRTNTDQLQVILVRYNNRTREIKPGVDILEASRFVEIKDVVSVSGFVQETKLHIYYLVKFQTVISKIVMELDDFGNLFYY